MNDKQRAKFTGGARNAAEAARIQNYLDTVAKEARFRGARAVGPYLKNLRAVLSKLDGVLTLTSEAPVYAPVWETSEGRARTPAEALDVAGANLRRAVSGGDLPAAFSFLGMMEQAVEAARR